MSQRPYRDTHNGVSVSDFHMIHQFPHGERGFHMETICGISIFDFRMIHQFSHGETGVFARKTHVGLGI